MESLLQQLEQGKKIDAAAASPKLPRLRMPWVRIVLATAAGLLFIGLALAHDTPVVMFVGLAPLAMIAVEAVWRLFDDPAHDGQDCASGGKAPRALLGSRLDCCFLDVGVEVGRADKICEVGRMKILVVDDHPLIREALPQVLRALDSTVEFVQAGTCADAMELTRRNPDISLILLDLALPGVDGFEALRQLRAEFPSIPVVVLSAYEQTDTVMRAIDGGAMGFIPKTSPTPVLIQALRLVLSGGIYLPPSIVGKQAMPTAGGGPLSGALPSLRNPREIGLTERQSQVLALMLHGKPNKLICRELNLSENTVKIHISAILRALSVQNRTQAVIAASKLGLKLPAPLSIR